MKFISDKPACQNIRKALRKEWLQTNGLGSYASSTIVGCNTRKYHGLLVAHVPHLALRFVLLSTLEESVEGAGREFFFSSRKHPGNYYPHGHEYLEYMETGDWPLFRYKIGPLTITRELVLVHGTDTLLLRYTVDCTDAEHPPLTLRVSPLLAYRSFHELTHENSAIQTSTESLPNGFAISPYPGLPTLYMQTEPQGAFTWGPDWYRNIDYLVEEERGFPHQEDLYKPGRFDIPLTPGTSILLSASTAPLSSAAGTLQALWDAEIARRMELSAKSATLLGHLEREGSRYLVRIPRTLPSEQEGQPEQHTAQESQEKGRLSLLAGYHWFDAWGRDTCIALPGLTFVAGRQNKGKELLAEVSRSVHNGLVANLFPMDGSDLHGAAFNSVDASLWYIWAVQQMSLWAPDKEETLNFIREICWPMMKDILNTFKFGRNKAVYMDEQALLHAGDAHTQLTWMDANAYGKPVTPRFGCPVEINALWYNALAFADTLSEKFGETERPSSDSLMRIRAHFLSRFWTPRMGGYLGDVWHNGNLDTSIRPNQIFAVSLPYPVLAEEEQPFVVECVRNNLLTPYGLRTLSPRNPQYKGRYEGGPGERDSAYHQGTVWPWLLGAYGDALLRTSWEVDNAVSGLLATLTPLYTSHLEQAGLGSISEIFDANPPHIPNGCIAQAWSVAECYRLLRTMQKAAPDVFAQWEAETGRR